MSNGAIDLAKANLEALIKMCAPLVRADDTILLMTQEKALSDVTLELTRQVTGPNDLIREQVVLFFMLCIQRDVTNLFSPALHCCDIFWLHG